MSRDNNSGSCTLPTGSILTTAGMVIFSLAVAKLGFYKKASQVAQTLLKNDCAQNLINEIKNILKDLNYTWNPGMYIAGGLGGAALILGIVILVTYKHDNLSAKELLLKAFAWAGITTPLTFAAIEALQKLLFDGGIDNAIKSLEKSQLCNSIDVKNVTDATTFARNADRTILGLSVLPAFIGLCFLVRFVVDFKRTQKKRITGSRGLYQSVANTATTDDEDPKNTSPPWSSAEFTD